MFVSTCLLCTEILNNCEISEYLKQRKTRYVNSLCPVLVRSVAVGPGVLITVVGSVGQVRRPVKRHSTADV